MNLYQTTKTAEQQQKAAHAVKHQISSSVRARAAQQGVPTDSLRSPLNLIVRRRWDRPMLIPTTLRKGQGSRAVWVVPALVLALLPACRSSTAGSNAQAALPGSQSTEALDARQRDKILHQIFVDYLGRDRNGWRITGSWVTATGAEMSIAPSPGAMTPADPGRLAIAASAAGCPREGEPVWRLVGPSGTVPLHVYSRASRGPVALVRCGRPKTAPATNREASPTAGPATGVRSRL